jgi:hypothetical protein
LHKEKEMLDSRKLFLALVVVALAAIPAFAQNPNPPLSCVAQAADTPSIRAEGVTEATGGILIICNGGDPTAAGANLRQVNIQIFSSPSINITSRIQSSGFSEAMLFIDEPEPSKQTICGSTSFPYSIPVGFPNQVVITGNCGAISGAPGGTGIGTYDPTVASTLAGTSRGNSWQARTAGNNSLIWQGIPFDPPGSLTTRTIRIQNVRVNASQLGVPAGAQASVSMVISTTASGVGNPINLPITNPAPTVAIAQNSLNFSVQSSRNCLQCESVNRNFARDPTSSLATTSGCGGLILRYEELFPSVFKRRNDANPGTSGENPPTVISQNDFSRIYQTESVFYRATDNGSLWPNTLPNGSVVSGTATYTLGLADHGTRLIARFANVQNGIQIWTPVSVAVVTPQGGGLQTGRARLINTDPNGAGPYSPVNASTTVNGGMAQVSIIGGGGQVVYEVINADTTAIDRVEIPLIFAWVANTTNGLPALGTATANGNLAPISTVATASSSAAIPRFVDGAVNRNMLTINSCRANLLYPFITNIGGFDTGMAISNTTADPFGTALQTGACTIYYYGTVGTSKVAVSYPTTKSITGGEYFVWSLSSGGDSTAVAGFQGYAIARCDFQYAHGYAFISDLGAQKLAQGYLALILDNPLADRGDRTGSVSEVLGH